jgi:hypothetical protein
MSREQGRNSMSTVHQPSDSGTDPLPPPEVTPYFRRVAEFRRVADQAAAERGWPPEPWPLP